MSKLLPIAHFEAPVKDMSIKQAILDVDPFVTGTRPDATKWPARWIQCQSDRQTPAAYAYRLFFSFDETTEFRIHVTADERYVLFVDGQLVARGSERGDAFNWYFESYDLVLEPGSHVIVALVWTMGTQAPYAQMSVHPGFLLCPDEKHHVDSFATGVANWEAKDIHTYEFLGPLCAWGTGLNSRVCPQPHDEGFERGHGYGWEPAKALAFALSSSDAPEFERQHLLRPATLPSPMQTNWSKGLVRHAEQIEAGPTSKLPFLAANSDAVAVSFWSALLREDRAIRVEPHQRLRVLVDLDDYVCAYPEIVTWGGRESTVRVHWQECLFDDEKATSKGNRNEIEGKYFTCIWHLVDGVGDVFHPDGSEKRRMQPLWWQCGRFVEIVVETADDALIIESLNFIETRYPLERESTFVSDDSRLDMLQPLMVRTLQMCAHETYFDCPFYEQLMYIGDTRLEVLATYAISNDDRLPRKALKMFDASRQLTGITQSRYPSRVRQTIAPFSLWYIGMVHDFALWRGDLEFVRELMPGVRSVLDWFAAHAGTDGLVYNTPGWNFIDWVPDWQGGTPPGGDECGGVLNIKLAWILLQAAELETWIGETHMAARWTNWSHKVSDSCRHEFWSTERGMFADNREQTSFSEHAQCLAILGGWLTEDESSIVARGYR